MNATIFETRKRFASLEELYLLPDPRASQQPLPIDSSWFSHSLSFDMFLI